MRNQFMILGLGLALCAGMSSTWAAPITEFKTREPNLLRDPVMSNDQLPPIILGLQWFAEQQAIRSRLLFPKETLEADAPVIGPRWMPEGANRR